MDPELSERLLSAVITRGRFTTPALGKAQDRFLRSQVATLADDVDDLQLRYLPRESGDRIVARVLKLLRAHLLKLPDTIASAAGLPARQVLDHAKACVHSALTEISDEFLAPRAWWDEPLRKAAAPLPLEPNRVKAAKLNLAATKSDIERLVARGDVRSRRDIVREVGERVATAKSLLLALPGRIDQSVSVASPHEARALIAAEVDGVLAELLPS
ncbi:MAG TPA: hypothetical protein VG757_07130 [Devosia sp.]|nr:hypothetical protein [Devosia sp.]